MKKVQLVHDPLPVSSLVPVHPASPGLQTPAPGRVPRTELQTHSPGDGGPRISTRCISPPRLCLCSSLRPGFSPTQSCFVKCCVPRGTSHLFPIISQPQVFPILEHAISFPWGWSGQILPLNLMPHILSHPTSFHPQMLLALP